MIIRFNPDMPKDVVTDDFPIRNTKRLTKALEDLNQFAPTVTWVLARLQGSGFKFWRLSVWSKPDYEGIERDIDGKTLDETLKRAKVLIRYWQKKGILK